MVITNDKIQRDLIKIQKLRGAYDVCSFADYELRDLLLSRAIETAKDLIENIKKQRKITDLTHRELNASIKDFLDCEGADDHWDYGRAWGSLSVFEIRVKVLVLDD